MPGGAPKGNRSRHNAMLVEKAIRKALAREYGSVTEGLIRLMKKQVSKAEEGDASAINTILDRLAGKAHQTVSGEINHTLADLNDSLLLEEKLAGTLKTRVGEPAEPPKRTLQ